MNTKKIIYEMYVNGTILNLQSIAHIHRNKLEHRWKKEYKYCLDFLQDNIIIDNLIKYLHTEKEIFFNFIQSEQFINLKRIKFLS